MSGPISRLTQFSSAPKEFIVLIDPEKEINEAALIAKCHLLNEARLPFVFVGGSETSAEESQQVSQTLKQYYRGKCIGFPGSAHQLNSQWDGLLFFSLVGSDNPQYLFKQQLEGTRIMQDKGLKPAIFPSSYILVGNHSSSTAQQTRLKTLDTQDTEAICLHALTARNFGMLHTYIEAGSGADRHVDPALIAQLRKRLDTLLIVGGGIKEPETATALWDAGADFIVVGNAIEENPELITAFTEAKNTCNQSLQSS